MSKTLELPQMVKARALALRLAISVRQLKLMTAAGDFPAPVRVGPRTLLYDLLAVEGWLAKKREASSTAQSALRADFVRSVARAKRSRRTRQ